MKVILILSLFCPVILVWNFKSFYSIVMYIEVVLLLDIIIFKETPMLQSPAVPEY